MLRLTRRNENVEVDMWYNQAKFKKPMRTARMPEVSVIANKMKNTAIVWPRRGSYYQNLALQFPFPVKKPDVKKLKRWSAK